MSIVESVQPTRVAIAVDFVKPFQAHNSNALKSLLVWQNAPSPSQTPKTHLWARPRARESPTAERARVRAGARTWKDWKDGI
jgi:hypothetical protein